MKTLGNILWIVFGGWIVALTWAVSGLLWCITILGIPWGMQCFKFAALTLAPFGKDVEFGGGPASFILNIIWLLISGIPLAIECVVLGAIFCVTIIGIPWGMQYFKIAKLALLPFGARIVPQQTQSGAQRSHA